MSVHTIINFAHPVSPAAKAAIFAMYNNGDEPDTWLDVTVQLDRTQPLKPQVEAIVGEAMEKVRSRNPRNVDCILLPGLAPAAVIVARMFPHANIIRLADIGTPPVWMPVELIPPARR